MITPIEIGLLVLAVIAILFARRILASIKTLVVNAVVGIVVLIIANWFGFGVPVTPLTLAITALAGVPGAILILLLSYGGIAFMPHGESGQLFADQLTNISKQFVGMLL